MEKLWYNGKNYGTMKKKLWCYGKNNDTIPKTMELCYTMKKNYHGT